MVKNWFYEIRHIIKSNFQEDKTTFKYQNLSETYMKTTDYYLRQ